ncbi:MAG: TolC family protein [Bacteroidota bacterium]
MLRIKYIVFIFFFFIQVDFLLAQDVWSLEKCIDYAVQNAPDISQANLDKELAALDLKGQKNQRLPELGASSNFGFQFGRTIDPTTNSFDNQRIGFNSIRLNSNVGLFSGGQVNNGIKQSEFLLESAEWSQKEAINQLKLDVLANYLATLLAEDQLEQVRLNQKDLQEQLKNLQKQVAAGTSSPTQRLEVEAQLSQNKQLVVQTKYQVELAYANLRNVLFLPPNQQIQIEKTAFEEVLPATFTEAQVYQQVQQKYPSLLAQNANLKAAEYDIKATRGALFPTIGLFGDVNTFYSTVATRTIGFESGVSTQQAILNGESVTLEFENERAIRESDPYFSQLNGNFGQGLGVFISVPIFNQGRNHLNIQRSQVNLLRTKLNYDNTKQQLNYQVEQALINVKAAWEILESAEENLAVMERLLKSKEREYQLGVTNSLDYFTTRNQRQTAVIQALQAKYDYIYKTQIVELYRQGELNF